MTPPQRKAVLWPVVLLCLILVGVTYAGVRILFNSDVLVPNPRESFEKEKRVDQSTLIPQIRQNTLIVGGEDANPPYSFLDNGQVMGLDNDLMRALGNSLGMKVVFNLSSLSEAKQALQNGDIDVINGMTFQKGVDSEFLYSTFHTIQQYDIFTRRDSKVRSLSDLNDKDIVIVLHDPMDDFLKEVNFSGMIFYAQNNQQALSWLASGYYDGALLPRIPAYYLIKSNHYSNLKGVGETPISFEYGYAVETSNRELWTRINQSMAGIENSGVYEDLSSKWLSPSQQASFFDKNEFLIYGVILLLAGTFIVSIWVWSLRRLVKRQTAELRKSEKQTRQLINNATEGVAVVVNRKIIYLNPHAAFILGMDEKLPEDGLELLDYIHSADHDVVLIKYRQLIESIIVNTQLSFRILTKDGRTRWVNTNTVRIDWRGQPALLSYFTDVTDQRLLQETIQSSEERYRLVFDQSPVGLFYFNTDLHIINVNDRFAEIMHAVRDQLHDYDLTRVKENNFVQALQSVLNQENGFFEGRIKPLLDQERPFLYVKLRATPIRNTKNEIQGGIGMLEDITGQMVSELKLQNLEDRFAKSFYTSPDAINISTLKEGKFIDINPSFTELTGFTRDEAIGKTAIELNIWTDHEDRQKLIKGLLAHGEYKNFELHYTSKQGNLKVGLLSSSIIEVDGEPCILSIIRDLEHLRKAEEQIRDSNTRYRSIFESVPISIWEQDFQQVYDMLDGLRKAGITDLNEYLDHHPGFLQKAIKSVKVLDVNEASLRIFKAESIRDLHLSLDEFFCEESMLHFRRLLIAFWNRDPFYDGDSVNLDLEGNRILINIVLRIPKDRQGFKSIIVSIVDITERKMAEQALRDSENRYRSIFNSVPVSIKEEDFSTVYSMLQELRKSGVTDLQEYMDSHNDWVKRAVASIKIIEVNEQTLQIYQAQDKAELFTTLDHYFLFESYPSFQKELVAIWNGQSQYEQETCNLTAKGERIDVWVSITIPKEEKDYSHLLVTAVDITERKKAEEQIHTQIRYLAALRAVDMAISASMDLPITLRVLVNQVHQQLMVTAVSILALDSHTQTLRFASGTGFKTSAIESTNLRLGQSYAGQAALERRVITADNLDTSASMLQTPSFDEEEFTHYMGVPLVAKGTVKGVLELFNQSPFNPDPAWMSLLESMAGQAAIAIENATLMDEVQKVNINLRSAYDATIEGWARSIDLRNGDSEVHSKQVADLTLQLAQSTGFTGEGLLNLRRGALLHDIGKLGVPDSILHKPGPLTDEEWQVMRTHPAVAKRLLTSIDFLQSAIEIPYSHHERWDGKGYPDGLKGQEIPFAARIFAIVDCWDSLRSDRPWRKAWTDENAWNYIESNSGKAFDPEIIEKFRQLLGHGFSPFF